jgi:uridylate kinase
VPPWWVQTTLETLGSITVKATSTADTSKSGTKSITVTGGSTDSEKTLVITNIDQQKATQGQNDIQIFIYSAGTTLPQITANSTGLLVAFASGGAISLSGTSAPFTATVILLDASDSDFSNSAEKWTGSGTYDIWVVLGSGNSTTRYRKQVSFTSASTSVDAAIFETVTIAVDDDGGPSTTAIQGSGGRFLKVPERGVAQNGKPWR